jgi:hypothetical protein
VITRPVGPARSGIFARRPFSTNESRFQPCRPSSAVRWAAVTDLTVAEVSASPMLATFPEAPRLGAAILWAASRDEAMVVEHLVSVGRRSALAGAAHFLVEIGPRLLLVSLGSDAGSARPAP